MSGAARPPLTRDEVDGALRRLRDDKERIGAALAELEAHPGHALLDGAGLTGETARRQGELRSRTAALWSLFDLYGRVLGDAERLRARHPRPSQAQLAELTRLLTGPSVELPAPEVPLERRTLLSAPAGERLTLDGAVARMNPLFEEAARIVAGVDAVWSALLARFDEVDRAHAAVRELAGRAGGAGDLDRVERELAAVRETMRTDPLALVRADGTAGSSRLDALDAELRDLRGRLEEAARLRAGHAERVARVRDAVGRVRRIEEQARRARADVLAKISFPVVPAAPDAAPALADRLAALDGLRDDGRWEELAARLADLDGAADTALTRAREAVDIFTGLLDRREELRGRLDAYRAKAARLGHLEDDELAAMYERARALLWTSPCDLRGATVALSAYQQAISARAKGSRR
ncbi:hypothetical protein [Actinomadura miaoliensis]|uniref:Uncharacterized protein n=1 Tax=Actinomadura miaoliensis TaxID=430685 RepID=A0ABP7VUS0_9ACTN